MTSYFPPPAFNSKHRDSFHPPSPPLSTSAGTPTTASARNPNPFDPNLYSHSPSASTPANFNDPAFRKDTPVDFNEELAALIKSSSPSGTHIHPASPSVSAYDDYSRHPPHNIFDVSAPSHSNGSHHFSSHYTVSVPSNGQFRPGSSHHGPDSPFMSHSPFSVHSDGGFPHHIPLPSPLPPLNINGHHPPGPEDMTHSPFLHQPPLSAIEHRRPPSPFEDSRSRSRSKPPAGVTSTTRTRMSKKRASISGIERPHPSAIMIPSNSSRPNTSSGSAPLSAHAMGWPAFSLPTPESMSTHGFGSFGEKSVLSQSKKEGSPDFDPTSKQAALAHEKRRRRRESHNAVERRRRDNINEKITELATLIPECLLDPNAGNPGGTSKDMGVDVFNAVSSGNGDDESKEPPTIKANKGMILRKSVEYIRYLQQLVTAQASRNRDLEAQLLQLQPHGGAMSSPSISSPHSSDSAAELNNHNFHVFGDELMNGLNSMGMVDILHSLVPDENDQYLGIQQYGGGKAHQRFDGLETLHENAQGDPKTLQRTDENGIEGDMELDDTSGSASAAASPEDNVEVDKEEAERGRARVRGRKVEEKDLHQVEVKQESLMEV